LQLPRVMPNFTKRRVPIVGPPVPPIASLKQEEALT